jgi:hypothetical protein
MLTLSFSVICAKIFKKEMQSTKKGNAMGKLGSVLIVFFLFLQVACSSNPALQKSGGESDILEPADAPSSETVSLPSPHLEKVLQLLASLGYQGIGLEYEDEATLNFLEAVFSSAKVRNRKILLIYTGMQYSYDKEQQSLTLGEDEKVAKALRFIEKNVPSR